MEDDGPDMIIIKDEMFDDGPSKSRPQENSRSDKGAVNKSHTRTACSVFIFYNVHIYL